MTSSPKPISDHCRTLLTSGPLGTTFRELMSHGRRVLPRRFKYWGDDYSGVCDMLTLTEPSLVDTLYREYLYAGADILLTNTFMSNRLTLSKCGLGDYAHRLNREGVLAARTAIKYFNDIDCGDSDMPACSDSSRYVAGAVGGIPVDENLYSNETMVSAYLTQIETLVGAGCDCVIAETMTSTASAAAALEAAALASIRLGRNFDTHVSFTLARDNHLPSGESLRHAAEVVGASGNAASIGLNCVYPSSRAAEQAARLLDMTRLPVSLRPSAAITYSDLSIPQDVEAPEAVAQSFEPLIKSGRLCMAGVCCGGGTHHIEALRQLIDKYQPS